MASSPIFKRSTQTTTSVDPINASEVGGADVPAELRDHNSSPLTTEPLTQPINQPITLPSDITDYLEHEALERELIHTQQESVRLARLKEEEEFRAKCQTVKGVASWVPQAAAVLTAGDTISALVRGKDLCGDKKSPLHAIGDSAASFVSKKLPGSGFIAETGKEIAVSWAAEKAADHITEKLKPKPVPFDVHSLAPIEFKPATLEPITMESMPMEIPAFHSNLSSRLGARRAAKAAVEAGPAELSGGTNRLKAPSAF